MIYLNMINLKDCLIAVLSALLLGVIYIFERRIQMNNEYFQEVTSNLVHENKQLEIRLTEKIDTGLLMLNKKDEKLRTDLDLLSDDIKNIDERETKCQIGAHKVTRTAGHIIFPGEVYIPYPYAFQNTPSVGVSVSQLDVPKNWLTRIHVFQKSGTNNGFTLVYNSNQGGACLTFEVMWIACPT